MKKPITVAIAIPCLLQGGTEMQSMYLCQVLLEAGYTVRVICYFEFLKNIAEGFKKLGCEVEMLNYSRSISSREFITTFKKYLQAHPPDILHVQYMAPGALPIIAARLAGITNVLATVHQPHTSSHGAKAKIFLRTISLLCRHFTCVSLAVEKSWFGSSRLLDSVQEKLPHHFTIYNTVNISLVSELANAGERNRIKKILKREEKFILGYYGRMREEKGFDILCAAFAEIYSQDKNVSMLVVGDGPQKSEMERMYSNEEFWQNIDFVGEKAWKDAVPYLAAMDLVIIPSRFEGFGLSAVEAMAAGKAVVASRTGGLPEIVEHDKTGMIVEPENKGDLIRAIMDIKGDGDKRRSMEKAARASAEHFSFEKYRKNILSLYKSLDREVASYGR